MAFNEIVNLFSKFIILASALHEKKIWFKKIKYDDIFTTLNNLIQFNIFYQLFNQLLFKSAQ